jgi:hypothetical protein
MAETTTSRLETAERDRLLAWYKTMEEQAMKRPVYVDGDPAGYQAAMASYNNNPLSGIVNSAFTEMTNLKVKGLDNGKITPGSDADNFLRGKLNEKRQQFSAGIDSGKADDGAGQQSAISQALGGDFMGAIKTFLMSLPIVGDFMAAGGKWLKSQFSKNPISFSQAREDVHLERSLTGGFGNMGFDAPTIQRLSAETLATYHNNGEIPGTAGSLTPLTQSVKVGEATVEKTIEGVGREAFKARMNDVNITLANGSPDPQFEALKKNIDNLPAEGNYMLVKLSKGELAIVSGPMSDNGTQIIPEKIYGVDGKGALVEKAGAYDRQPLQTSITPPVEFQVSKAKPIERTLSDNVSELRQRIFEETKPGQEGLLKLHVVLAAGIKNDKGEDVPATMRSVLVTMPDNTSAVVTGTYDAATNALTPAYLTTLNGGSIKTEALKDAKPMTVTPTYDGAKLAAGPAQAKIADLVPALAGSPSAHAKALGAALAEALKDPDHLLVTASKSNPKMKHVAVTLPGGGAVIVSGIESDDGKKLTPKFQTKIGADGKTLDLPVESTDKNDIDLTTGRTARPASTVASTSAPSTTSVAVTAPPASWAMPSSATYRA